MTGKGDVTAAKSKNTDPSAPSDKFPVWAFIVILGTAIISLSLSWGCLCYRKKKKQQRTARGGDCEEAGAEKWYGSPNLDPKNGRLIKSGHERSASSPALPQLPVLTGGPRRPARPRSTTISGNFLYELDASELQRPPNVWRDSWHAMMGLVVGGRPEVRTSRIDREFPILPKVPIPKGATIERRNEIRWKPSYPGT